jgi:hypothetical protein
MSIIRDLLYNGAVNHAFVHSTLYNQTLLHRFILQHQPKYILHCGCPNNAVSLAYFIREYYACEILHIKNWTVMPYQWLESKGKSVNPYQEFLDIIKNHGLDNQLVPFDGTAQTAYHVLNAKHFRFDMMVSDVMNNDTDYVELLPLLAKNRLHIRYVGDKKISDFKSEPIFQSPLDVPFTYAQGYLITGMDYLSLYDDNNKTDVKLEITPELSPKMIHNQENNSVSDPIWTENGFVYDDISSTEQNQANIMPPPNTQNTQQIELSPQEARTIRREERRQAREERQKNRMLATAENEQKSVFIAKMETAQNTATALVAERPKIQNETHTDDDETGISATRRALRARRLARRMALVNKNAD